MRAKRVLQLIGASALTLTASAAMAGIGGHNVVLIHGFQPDNLLSGQASVSEIDANSDEYWAEFWSGRADAQIGWDSTERIEGGIAQDVFRQIKDIARSEICDNACIYVTHSTGDLVARYALENQDRWLTAAGLQPFDVIATVDLAGAGGGTNLANLGISTSESDSFLLSPVNKAVEAFVGFNADDPDNLGVVNDLQTSIARNTAISPNDVPRLRIAGGGSDFFGLTGPFVKGNDDGVVSMASSCGSVSVSGVDSCISQRAADGEVKNTNAPDGLYHNHLPFLMSDKAGHLNMLGSGDNQTATTGNGFEGVSLVDVETNRITEGGSWWNPWDNGTDFVRVPGSSDTHLSQTTYEALR